MAKPKATDWPGAGTGPSGPIDHSHLSLNDNAREQAERVFLDGCDLPLVWRGQHQWRILENGFGLGLNFLLTWKAWRNDPQRPQRLHFVSTEVCAAKGTDLIEATGAQSDLLSMARQLAEQFQGLVAGVHRLSFDQGQVLLTLIIGSEVTALRDLELTADSVFLNGLAPANHSDNPDADLLKAIARCCRRGTKLSTWTKNRRLIDTLQASGFVVGVHEAQPQDQHPVQAMFEPRWPVRRSQTRRPAARTAASCTIVGAGLAGASTAASLARRGWQIHLIDAHGAAAGASGLPVGLLAAHVSPDDSLLSRLSRAGVRATWVEAERLLVRGQDYDISGVLQRRLQATPTLPKDWPAAGQHWSRQADGSTGLTPDLSEGAIWHAQAGWIKPAQLVQAWLSEASCRVLVNKVQQIHRDGPDWLALDSSGRVLARSPLMVLANAHDAQRLLGAAQIQGRGWQTIRGQVSWARVQAGNKLPLVPVNGHGSFVPCYPDADGPRWLLGASFDRDQTDLAPWARSQKENFDKLARLLPETAASLTEPDVQSWVGLRCAWRDHMPLIGPVDEQRWPGLWLCTAFGSRGLSYASVAGELIASWLNDEPLPVEERLAHSLRASRLLT